MDLHVKMVNLYLQEEDMVGILSTLWVIAFFNTHPVTLVNNTSEAFPVRAGWYNGHVIRYVPLAASNRKLADVLNNSTAVLEGCTRVDYAPALQNTIDKNVLGDVYFLNCGQDAIFSSDPTYIGYTPLWRVHYLAWATNSVSIHITSETQVKDLLASPASGLIEILPPSVLDATIVIDSNGKMIPQAKKYDNTYGAEKIWLKVFRVFYLGSFYLPQTRYMALCDVSDRDLATSTGANYAPYLANAYESSNLAFAFENPSSFAQYPIIDQVQRYDMFSGTQLNQLYNPIKNWTLFERGMLNSNAIVNNPKMMLFLENYGTVTRIDLEGPIVTNSPVMSNVKRITAPAFGNIAGDPIPIDASQTTGEPLQRR